MKLPYPYLLAGVTIFLSACSPPAVTVDSSLVDIVEVKSCTRLPTLKCVISNRTDKKIRLSYLRAVMYDGSVKKFSEGLTGELDPNGSTEVLITSLGPMDSASTITIQRQER